MGNSNSRSVGDPPRPLPRSPMAGMSKSWRKHLSKRTLDSSSDKKQTNNDKKQHPKQILNGQKQQQPEARNGKSKNDDNNKDLKHFPSSFHEGLVRERDRKHDFDDIYQILNEIGHGGLCKIYKVQKYNNKIGGSSRPEGVRHKGFGSSIKRNLTISFPHGSHISPISPRPTWTSIQQHQSSPSLSVRGRAGSSDEDKESPSTSINSSPPVPPRPSPLMERAKTEASTGSINMYFALKVINLALVKEDSIGQLKNEVEILKTLDHKNIIKAYETFQMRKHKKLMIIMELCTGGDMYARMPYTEMQVANAMRQVLSAIEYMHSKHIIHRDLKMENILWESKHPLACIKVIDFGLSKRYSPQNNILTERVGTLYCMSPETMKGIYTTQADLWSIGVLTYIMLSMNKPFEGQTPKQMVANVLQCNYKFETDPPVMTASSFDTDKTPVDTAAVDAEPFEDVWDNISDQAKQFISKLLVLEPSDRLTATQAKNDDWFETYMKRRNGSSNHSSQDPQIGAPLESFGDSEESSEKKDEGGFGGSFLPPLATEEFKDRVRANLIGYAEMGEFRRLALNVIAKKSTSNEIFELREVFDEFDTLNTGTITLEEFKAALSQFSYSEEDLLDIFHKIDVNRSNVINYTEFLAAALETQGSIEEYRLAEAFDMLDSDDSGYISRDNLRQILGDRAKDEKYLDRLIAEADFKKDGRISYEEFLQVFSRDRRDDIQSRFYEHAGARSMEQELEADEVLQRHGISFSPSSSSRGAICDPFDYGGLEGAPPPPLTEPSGMVAIKSVSSDGKNSDSSTGSRSKRLFGRKSSK